MTPEFEKKAIFFLICFACLIINVNVAAIAAALPSIARDLNLSGFEAGYIYKENDFVRGKIGR